MVPGARPRSNSLPTELPGSTGAANGSVLEERTSNAATQSIPTTSEMTAHESPTLNVSGSAQVAQASSCFKIVKDVLFMGRKYTVTVTYPFDEPPSSSAGHAALQATAEEFVKLLCVDLEQTLNGHQDKVKPGDTLNIVFDRDGYSVATSQNRELSDIDDVSKSEIKGNTPQSKALCEAMGEPFVGESEPSSGSGESDPFVRHARSIHKKLQAECLNAHRARVEQKTAQEAAKSGPVNCCNPSNACYITTAFHHLVDDPALAKELNDPANYINEAQNPLYRANQGYRAHQASRREGKFDAIPYFEELGLNTNSADDFMVAWTRFREQFDWKVIAQDSLLRRACNTLRGKASDGNLDAMLQTAWSTPNIAEQSCSWHTDRPADIPDILTLHVEDRLARADELSTIQQNLQDDQKTALYTCLSSIVLIPGVNEALTKFFPEQEYDCSTHEGYLAACRRVHGSELARFGLMRERYLPLLYKHLGSDGNALRADLNRGAEEQEEPSVAQEPGKTPLEWADIILNNRDAFDLVRFLINKIQDSDEVEKAIITIEKQFRGTHRNQNPVKIKSDGTTTCLNKKFRVVHFTVHIPARNHYVCYALKGNTWHELDDKNQSVRTFSSFPSHEAKKATFYTLHAEGLTPVTSAAGSESDGQAQQQQVDYTTGELTKITGSGTILSEDEGDLRGVPAEYQLVNPMFNMGAHPEIEKAFGKTVPEQNQAQNELAKAITTNKVYQQTFGGGFLPRRWWFNARKPGTIQTTTRGLKLINLPISSLANADDIKQATLDALEYAKANKITHIAFPLFFCSNKRVDVLGTMKAAITEFAQKNTSWVGNCKIIRHKNPNKEKKEELSENQEKLIPTSTTFKIAGHDVTVKAIGEQTDVTAIGKKTSVPTYSPKITQDPLNFQSSTEVVLDLTQNSPKALSKTPFLIAKLVRKEDGNIDYDALYKLIPQAQNAKGCKIQVRCLKEEAQDLQQGLQDAEAAARRATNLTNQV